MSFPSEKLLKNGERWSSLLFYLFSWFAYFSNTQVNGLMTKISSWKYRHWYKNLMKIFWKPKKCNTDLSLRVHSPTLGSTQRSSGHCQVSDCETSRCQSKRWFGWESISALTASFYKCLKICFLSVFKTYPVNIEWV